MGRRRKYKMAFLTLKQRDKIPQPFRRWLFRVYPGRWTQDELDDIHRRAAAMKAQMDLLID